EVEADEDARCGLSRFAGLDFGASVYVAVDDSIAVVIADVSERKLGSLNGSLKVASRNCFLYRFQVKLCVPLDVFTERFGGCTSLAEIGTALRLWKLSDMFFVVYDFGRVRGRRDVRGSCFCRRDAFTDGPKPLVSRFHVRRYLGGGITSAGLRCFSHL